MKTVLGTALMSMLLISPVIAGEMEGKIKSIDMKKHMIMMEDGMSVMTRPEVKLDHFKPGEHVKMTIDKDKMATAVESMK
jgi:Protein of unknown function (DUF1344)